MGFGRSHQGIRRLPPPVASEVLVILTHAETRCNAERGTINGLVGAERSPPPLLLLGSTGMPTLRRYTRRPRLIPFEGGPTVGATLET